MGNLPAPVRHLILVVIAAILTAVGTNVDAFGLPDSYVPFVSALVTYGLAWVTPLVQSYGVGSESD